MYIVIILSDHYHLRHFSLLSQSACGRTTQQLCFILHRKWVTILVKKKIVPLYFMECLIAVLFQNDKNSAMCENELKTPQSIAWSPLNVRVQVLYLYKSSRT